jgi:hypothetical protein
MAYGHEWIYNPNGAEATLKVAPNSDTSWVPIVHLDIKPGNCKLLLLVRRKSLMMTGFLASDTDHPHTPIIKVFIEYYIC